MGEGAGSRDRYERYKNTGSIRDALDSGATKEDLKKDLNSGFAFLAPDILCMGIVESVQMFASVLDDQICFHQENPKKPRSKAWARYERYKHATSVRAAKSAGIWPGDIRNDLGHGFMKFGNNQSRSS